MVFFKRIEIDLEKERKRIKSVGYTSHQKAALLKLVNLFEQGKWQECLNHVNDEEAFPYNEKGEYSEREHVNTDIGDILRDLAYYNYYTQEELLAQAKKKLETSK